MNMNDLNRLKRLEQQVGKLSHSSIREGQLSISEVLNQDDPIRLAGVLAAAVRSGLCSDYPEPEDDSDLAEFLRAAWRAGLIPSKRA